MGRMPVEKQRKILELVIAGVLIVLLIIATAMDVILWAQAIEIIFGGIIT